MATGLQIETFHTSVNNNLKPPSSVYLVSRGVTLTLLQSFNLSFHPLLPFLYSNQAEHHIGFLTRTGTSHIYYYFFAYVKWLELQRERRHMEANGK